MFYCSLVRYSLPRFCDVVVAETLRVHPRPTLVRTVSPTIRPPPGGHLQQHRRLADLDLHHRALHQRGAPHEGQTVVHAAASQAHHRRGLCRRSRHYVSGILRFSCCRCHKKQCHGHQHIQNGVGKKQCLCLRLCLHQSSAVYVSAACPSAGFQHSAYINSTQRSKVRCILLYLNVFVDCN